MSYPPMEVNCLKFNPIGCGLKVRVEVQRDEDLLSGCIAFVQDFNCIIDVEGEKSPPEKPWKVCDGGPRLASREPMSELMVAILGAEKGVRSCQRRGRGRARDGAEILSQLLAAAQTLAKTVVTIKRDPRPEQKVVAASEKRLS